MTQFDLPANVRRIGLNYMGCHGGVKCLETARALAREQAHALVLVVCVELCSVHKFAPRMLAGAEALKMDVIANLLFADGCAAMLVENGAGAAPGAALPPPALEIVDRCVAQRQSEQVRVCALRTDGMRDAGQLDDDDQQQRAAHDVAHGPDALRNVH